MAQGPVVHGALRVVPDALLLGAAWVLCVPPSRALGTAMRAGKALNHGTNDHRPIFALFASADIPKLTITTSQVLVFSDFFSFLDCPFLSSKQLKFDLICTLGFPEKLPVSCASEPAALSCVRGGW